MIYGHIEHHSTNECLPAAIKKCLQYLNDTDLAQLSIGKHVIDGELMYANVMEFNTGDAAEKFAEVHKEYIDVQCLISGTEMIQFALADKENAIEKPYDEANDFYLVQNMKHVNQLVLYPHMFAIFFPEEPHKPGCFITESAPIKKIVIKVHRTLLS